MDEERVDLLRQLFVAITERVEAAHSYAMDGQALHATSDAYRTAADRMNDAAGDMTTLARAVVVLARAGGDCVAE
ncbi:MAG: hypothetical protein JWL62_3823 [Hyphomicrobiales bacterium]|nr:hypothetical protein [Hyphomicrobiales bacterium]